MIPSYSEQVQITMIEQSKDTGITLENLQTEIRQLRTMVEYQDRERQRLKSEIDQLKLSIKKQV